MSLLRCDECDRPIDTDDEPEAYQEDRDIWLCYSCREMMPALLDREIE